MTHEDCIDRMVISLPQGNFLLQILCSISSAFNKGELIDEPVDCSKYWLTCMQRPVHPSYGQVTQNVDGCLFVWTGKKKIIMYPGLQYVGLLRTLYTSCCHIICVAL